MGLKIFFISWLRLYYFSFIYYLFTYSFILAFGESVSLYSPCWTGNSAPLPQTLYLLRLWSRIESTDTCYRHNSMFFDHPDTREVRSSFQCCITNVLELGINHVLIPPLIVFCLSDAMSKFTFLSLFKQFCTHIYINVYNIHVTCILYAYIIC
jgi:hypothetical protein